ncbi:hypothetical protein [Mariniflexile sp. HMF6888]|uniref:hypothetical protein n=1 Tax=Mariniflexile sp. HMF6888 TaxID=3373086 RepID=UPI0037A3C51E
MNNIMITTGIIWRGAFLLVPLTGITLWFLYDGGIGFGWNLIWYWIWIIGFLLLYQIVLLSNLILNYTKIGFSTENKVFMLIGLLLLVIAIVFFMSKLGR